MAMGRGFLRFQIMPSPAHSQLLENSPKSLPLKILLCPTENLSQLSKAVFEGSRDSRASLITGEDHTATLCTELFFVKEKLAPTGPLIALKQG